MRNPRLFTWCFGWCSPSERSSTGPCNKIVKSAPGAVVKRCRGKFADTRTLYESPHEHTVHAIIFTQESGPSAINTRAHNSQLAYGAEKTPTIRATTTNYQSSKLMEWKQHPKCDAIKAARYVANTSHRKISDAILINLSFPSTHSAFIYLIFLSSSVWLRTGMFSLSNIVRVYNENQSSRTNCACAICAFAHEIMISNDSSHHEIFKKKEDKMYLAINTCACDRERAGERERAPRGKEWRQMNYIFNSLMTRRFFLLHWCECVRLSISLYRSCANKRNAK